MKLQVLSWLFVACRLVGADEELSLRIAPSELTVKSGSLAHVGITIENKSKKTATLVMPRDGSDYGWRTPIVGWSMIPVSKDGAEVKGQQHPKEPLLKRQPRCGNINALRMDDIFELKPGEKKVIDASWISTTANLAPGQYKAVFYYTNDPGKRVMGIPLGRNEAGAERAIKRSTQCDLISNEIVVTVVTVAPQVLK
jgi:hypothetical protein